MVIIVVFLCAFILRFYTLNTYDLWFDEEGTNMFSSDILTKTAQLSGISPSALMVDQMKNDPHSPLYYVVVYFYSFLFGSGQSLRILSVVFSMLSLGIFYLLSRLCEPPK